MTPRHSPRALRGLTTPTRRPIAGTSPRHVATPCAPSASRRSETHPEDPRHLPGREAQKAVPPQVMIAYVPRSLTQDPFSLLTRSPEYPRTRKSATLHETSGCSARLRVNTHIVKERPTGSKAAWGRSADRRSGHSSRNAATCNQNNTQ
jgi:hypothetical protein